MTRMELNKEGGLYASVTLPNLMLGTVGGGTGLPSQKACLDLLGLHGNGKSQALAEVVLRYVWRVNCRLSVRFVLATFTSAP